MLLKVACSQLAFNAIKSTTYVSLDKEENELRNVK